MKTHYLLFFIVLLFCGKATYAQGITYEKAFGGLTSGEWQDDIKEMKSGGYLVTGSTENFGAGNYDAYCIRLDEKGKMLWSKTYGTSLSEFGTKCRGTSDGGFILSFFSFQPQGNKDSGVFVVKCNENGNVQWSKFIKNTKATSITPTYLYESKKGDFYLLCDWYGGYYYYRFFALLKLDAVGNFMWQKTVDPQPLAYFKSTQIAETDNGAIIVAGNSEGDNWSTYGSYIHLFLFSHESGNIKFCKKIYPQSIDWNTQLIIDNLVVENNKFSITGTYSKDGFSYGVYWLSAKPGDSQVKAQYIPYKDFYCYQYLKNKHLIKQPNGGCYSSYLFTKDGGYIHAYRYFTKIANGYDIIVDKFDSLGRICPKFKTPVVDTTVQETAFNISDKSYSLIKSSVTIIDSLVTVTDVTAQQTFCEGTAPVITNKFENTSSVIADKISEVKLQLYPNPAADFVNISFEVNKPATIQFNIINAEGKTVLTKQLFALTGKQQTTLNIQSLPPGAYYIKIIGLNKPAAIQFLKIK